LILVAGILLDPEHHFHYTLLSKKRLLITLPYLHPLLFPETRIWAKFELVERAPGKIKTRLVSGSTGRIMDKDKRSALEIVLKCDSAGSEEAVLSSLDFIRTPDVELKVVHSGVGEISKSDLLLAGTAGMLIVGFNVGVAQKIEEQSKAQGIEIRLYDVIYQLTRDLQNIAATLGAREEEKEKITGKAKVIALFKTAKGIILGCEVLEGTLALGKNFRVISAMGPIYTGKIKSLQIENKPVQAAKAHDQVGIKVPGLRKQVKIGDLVECFQAVRSDQGEVWHPKGGVFKPG
jgi:translation initiation factor IF-2